MIAAFLIDPNLRAQKLNALAFTELGLKMNEPNEVRPPTAENADIVFRLYESLINTLSEKDLLDLAEKIEFPLIPVLGEMELIGIKVDCKSLNELSKESKTKIEKLKKRIHTLAGREFNIASPAQLQEIIFDELKIHEKIDDPRDLKKLKSGGYSTAASELEKLKDKHEIIADIFKFRELSKLQNTYIDVLPN
jgi:DNA polymerase I